MRFITLVFIKKIDDFVLRIVCYPHFLLLNKKIRIKNNGRIFLLITELLIFNWYW